MRTNEPPPIPQRPLGEKVVPAKPARPAGATDAGDWRANDGAPGIEQNARGQLRTNLPLPK